MRFLWIVMLMVSFASFTGCAAIKGAREDKAEARANALKAAKNPVKQTIQASSSSDQTDNFNQATPGSKASDKAGKMLSPIVQ